MPGDAETPVTRTGPAVPRKAPKGPGMFPVVPF